jgi:hypothetical protein
MGYRMRDNDNAKWRLLEGGMPLPPAKHTILAVTVGSRRLRWFYRCDGTQHHRGALEPPHRLRATQIQCWRFLPRNGNVLILRSTIGVARPLGAPQDNGPTPNASGAAMNLDSVSRPASPSSRRSSHRRYRR